MKPPLGIMPKIIWMKIRAEELADAIQRRTDADFHDEKLLSMIAELRKLELEIQQEAQT